MSLILLTGKDDFRIWHRKKFYLDAFTQKYPDAEIEVFEKNTPVSTVVSSSLTSSLFGGGRRAIVLDGYFSPDNFEALEKSGFFQKIKSTQNTVFIIEKNLDKRTKWAKFLLKNTHLETFDLMDERGISEFLKNYIADNNIQMDANLFRLLMARCGTNLWNLTQEIKKCALAGDGTVTAELIQTMTLPHPELEIWDFLTVFSQKNISKSVDKFRDLVYSGNSPYQILSMIMRECRIHAMIRDGIERNFDNKRIASEAGLHPFVVQKTKSLTQNFSRAQIANLYELCLDLDKSIKTGGLWTSTDDMSEMEIAIEKLMVRGLA